MNRLLLLLFCLAFAATLSAQYVRTTSTAAYSERSGGGVLGNVVRPDTYGQLGAWVLPFDFPFYDRTYRQILVNGHGRVGFTTDNAEDPADTGDLTGGVSNTTLRGCIHAISGELVFSPLRTNIMTVHFESGRVVVQWKDAAFINDNQLQFFDFQVHLLDTGVIELHMGPNNNLGPDQPDFISGIANFAGTSVTAGFGNVLTRQSTLPADGSVVTFTPGAFMMASGVEVRCSANGNVLTTFGSNAGDVVFGRFSLTARGAGGTVSSIQVDHADAGGDPITMRIMRDNAPKGVLDGTDVQVGTTQSPAASTSVFSGLSEAITTGTTDYLVIANIGSLTDSSLAAFVVSGADMVATSTVWGVSGAPFVGWIEGPFANIAASQDRSLEPLVTAASGEQPGLSFEVTRGVFFDIDFGTFDLIERRFDFGALTTTTMGFNAIFNGAAITDIATVRLYRDGGTIGALDAKDVLLGTITSPVSSALTFSGLSEVASLSGTDYLLTFTLSAAYSGFGDVRFQANDNNFVSSTAGADYGTNGAIGGDSIRLAGGTRVVISTPFEAFIDQRPVSGGETDLTACPFSLQTTTGSATVTALTFTGTLAVADISSPRLFRDAGTRGVLDAADTLVAITPTVAVNQIALAGLSESIGVTPSYYILVFNVAAAPPSASFGVNLANTGVITGGTVSGSAGGTQFARGGTLANGVDITQLQLLNNGATLDGTEMLPVCRVQLTPRGLGGDAPSLLLSMLDAVGGVGNGSGLQFWVFLEGAGPLGKLDASDIHIPTLVDNPLTIDLGQANGDVNVVRNMLVCVNRRNPSITGSFGLTIAGFISGTDLRLLTPLPVGQRSSFKVAISSGGGGGDDGGCSTDASDSRLNLALLAGLMGTMFVGLRMRRRAA